MVKEENMEGGRRIVREIRRIGTSEGDILQKKSAGEIGGEIEEQSSNRRYRKRKMRNRDRDRRREGEIEGEI